MEPVIRARVASTARRVVCGLAAAMAMACSGGGGGGSDPVTCTDLSFSRALTTPSSGDVYLDQAGGTCTTIDISVVISNLSGIWTVGFDLSYPTSLLMYQSYAVGPLLLKGSPVNAPLTLVLPTSGGIQVTMSRFGTDPPVTASGSEALLTLKFSRIASGAGTIDFNMGAGSTVSEVVLDDTGTPQPAVFGPGHGGVVTIP